MGGRSRSRRPRPHRTREPGSRLAGVAVGRRPTKTGSRPRRAERDGGRGRDGWSRAGVGEQARALDRPGTEHTGTQQRGRPAFRTLGQAGDAHADGRKCRAGGAGLKTGLEARRCQPAEADQRVQRQNRGERRAEEEGGLRGQGKEGEKKGEGVEDRPGNRLAGIVEGNVRERQ